MCFCTKVRISDFHCIVLLFISNLAILFLAVATITLKVTWLVIRLNVCQCGTSVQNISYIYCVQIMWRLIRDDRILTYWAYPGVYEVYHTCNAEPLELFETEFISVVNVKYYELMNFEFSKLSEKLPAKMQNTSTKTRPNKFSFEKQKSVSLQDTF